MERLKEVKSRILLLLERSGGKGILGDRWRGNWGGEGFWRECWL